MPNPASQDSFAKICIPSAKGARYVIGSYKYYQYKYPQSVTDSCGAGSEPLWPV